MPPNPPILTFAEHGEGIGDAAAVLRSNAASAGLEAAVPTCPDWSVLDLLAHQGAVFRWAAAVVRGGEAAMDPAVEAEGRAATDLLDWVDEGLVGLLNALAGAPPELTAFFFLKDAPPAREAWARRQCHECTIHAVDAMAARLGRPPTAAETWIRPRLAADGVDELLTGFVPRGKQILRSADPLTVAVRATDTGHAWALQISDQPVITTRLDGAAGTARADVTLTATAVQLYLGLWNRGEEIELGGREDWLTTWREQLRIT
jgi:uncharacterized protein (TIGR03083 family)